MKKIEKPKKNYISLISRKFSDDQNGEGRAKFVSTSLIIQDSNERNDGMIPYGSSQLNPNPMANLNLSKKGRTEAHQSSAANTQREDQSLGKFAGGKISLSQLKKNQIEGDRQQFRYTMAQKSNSKDEGEFRKHSHTTAIKYKNKIKQYINQQ